jgi:hypothetical protein
VPGARNTDYIGGTNHISCDGPKSIQTEWTMIAILISVVALVLASLAFVFSLGVAQDNEGVLDAADDLFGDHEDRLARLEDAHVFDPETLSTRHAL